MSISHRLSRLTVREATRIVTPHLTVVTRHYHHALLLPPTPQLPPQLLLLTTLAQTRGLSRSSGSKKRRLTTTSDSPPSPPLPTAKKTLSEQASSGENVNQQASRSETRGDEAGDRTKKTQGGGGGGNSKERDWLQLMLSAITASGVFLMYLTLRTNNKRRENEAKSLKNDETERKEAETRKLQKAVEKAFSKEFDVDTCAAAPEHIAAVKD